MRGVGGLGRFGGTSEAEKADMRFAQGGHDAGSRWHAVLGRSSPKVTSRTQRRRSLSANGRRIQAASRALVASGSTRLIMA